MSHFILFSPILSAWNVHISPSPWWVNQGCTMVYYYSSDRGMLGLPLLHGLYDPLKLGEQGRGWWISEVIWMVLECSMYCILFPLVARQGRMRMPQTTIEDQPVGCVHGIRTCWCPFYQQFIMGGGWSHTMNLCVSGQCQWGIRKNTPSLDLT